MSKGTRRERQAREMYTAAGFECQTFHGQRYSDKDGFGVFDFIAMQPGRPVELVQVKSNTARGIETAKVEVAGTVPFGRCKCRYLVCHDRAGWRLITFTPDHHEITVDGRDRDTDMGQPVIDYLED